MGTRAIVRVFDGAEELCAIYRQNDGYPNGLGREVADFCATKRIVNGINSRMRSDTIANGAGCLAAQLIGFLKEGPGRVYIYPVGCDSQSYEYAIKCPATEAVEAAYKRHFETGGVESGWDGLPIAVEAYSCTGGYGDKPLVKELVEIPGSAQAADGDSDTAKAAS